MTPAATVLVVDDDDDLRAMLALLLRDQGWHVVEAGTGEEALARVREHVPDVIVTDQRMPGLSGTELVARLRADGVQSPAILITAARDAGAIAATLGTRWYLAKPFELRELLALVARARAGTS